MLFGHHRSVNINFQMQLHVSCYAWKAILVKKNKKAGKVFYYI